jgi:hypothetical protein
MNSLNILFSYDYISDLFSITWFDILFGINENFLSSKAALEYSYDIIERPVIKSQEKTRNFYQEKYEEK